MHCSLIVRLIKTFCFSAVTSYALVAKNPNEGCNHQFHSLVSIERRQMMRDLLGLGSAALTLTVNPRQSFSENLPKSTGADLSKTGTIDSLVPIVRMYTDINKVNSLFLQSVPKDSTLSDTSIQSIYKILDFIPKNEVPFKRIFDEYSDPVSYKQKFMDQNAFLVYYTKGFDGPNRPNIESDIPKQTFQYGFRNDAWVAFDDFMVEMSYATSDGSSNCADLSAPLQKMITAIGQFLETAPIDDLQQAKKMLSI